MSAGPGNAPLHLPPLFNSIDVLGDGNMLEVGSQAIREPLPAHLAISGNQTTEIHFLAPALNIDEYGNERDGRPPQMPSEFSSLP